MKKIPIKEIVYNKLRDMIISGEIKPGTRIIETEYSEKFKVSRTPVREAIRMLELENFVEYNAYGGVIVPVITKSDIEEIYKIRIALEAVIIEEVIQNIHEQDISKIEILLSNTDLLMNDVEKCESTELKTLIFNKIFDNFSEFNIILYEVANTPRVIDLIKHVNSFLKRFRKLSVDNNVQRISAHKSHIALFEAIKEKKLAKALKLNKLHLEKSRDFIMKKF